MVSLDRLRRLEGANDDDDPATHWPQTELEQFLGVNSQRTTPPLAADDGRPRPPRAPMWPAALFFLAILAWALVFLIGWAVYGLWSGAVWALRIFHP